MAATMTTTPRSGDDTTLLGNDAVPLGARLATTTARSGDDADLGDDATPLGARLVTTTPLTTTTLTPCRRSLTTTPLTTTTLTPCRRSLTTMTPRSTTSRTKTTPRSAMMQCSSTTGFDLLSGKIRAVHRAINPGIYLSDLDNLEQIAVNAATAVGRKVKSLFTEGLGKRKIVEVD